MTAQDIDYQQFVQNLQRKTGINLSYYKENQMRRRLTSLIEKKGFSNFNDFYNALWQNEELYGEFLDRMTINVSEFFRNGNRWEVLKSRVIPDLIQNKRIKCWSAACSTGEEPYTLSMILKNYFPDTKAEIIANDIDEIALKKAQEGIYFDRSMKEVPENIKSKYFKVENKLFYITDEIKSSVKFKRLDLLIDRFDTNYDLIICRNVMIYFTDEAKNLLYQKFSDALRPGGVLFVGSTEQIFNPAKYNLETIDNFFYRKK